MKRGADWREELGPVELGGAEKWRKRYRAMGTEPLTALLNERISRRSWSGLRCACELICAVGENVTMTKVIYQYYEDVMFHSPPGRSSLCSTTDANFKKLLVLKADAQTEGQRAKHTTMGDSYSWYAGICSKSSTVVWEHKHYFTKQQQIQPQSHAISCLCLDLPAVFPQRKPVWSYYNKCDSEDNSASLGTWNISTLPAMQDCLGWHLAEKQLI